MATSGRRREPPRLDRAASAAVSAERPDGEQEFALAPDGPAARISPANMGDHGLIAAFLESFRRLSADDFHHWLDAPDYRPADRLLVRHDGRILGHVHLTHRPLEWGAARVPSVALHDLAVPPFFGEAECRRRLLQAAESQGRSDGALVATLRANEERARLAELGWVLAPGHAMTHAPTRELLAYLTPPRRSARWSARRRAPRVRMWRRVQLPVLMSIYRASTEGKTGAVRRNEDYWQWLLSRKAHDQVTVVEAARGKNARPSVLGYAMMRSNQIIELMNRRDDDRASVELLIRACRDALEGGFETIAIELPARHPLHELVVTAGGAYLSGGATQSGELHLRALDPAGFVRTLSPEFQDRARRAGIAAPVSLVIVAGGQPMEFVLSRRGARLTEAPAAPPDVVCSEEDFERMLLGQLSVGRAIAGGRVAVLSDGVDRKLAALFPQRTIWQSALDSRVSAL